MSVTLLNVGVAVEVQDTLARPLLIGNFVQKLLSQVDTFLSPIRIVAEDRHIGRNRGICANFQNLIGSISESGQTIMHSFRSSTGFGDITGTSSLAVAVASQTFEVIVVVVHADHFEIQIWYGVEKHEVWDVEVCSGVATNTALVDIQLIARICLRCIGKWSCASAAATNARACHAWIEERTQASRICISKIMISQNDEPWVVCGELFIHIFPCQFKAVV
mmetsp:Transcript_48589/g.77335  ORF Transcript_48589/g.77335 Transcript_48589/m.77335 type:complete len:220 (+) Transcript_48589:460-1119(+)